MKLTQHPILENQLYFCILCILQWDTKCLSPWPTIYCMWTPHEPVSIFQQGSTITYQDYLSNPWVTYPIYYVINLHTLVIRSICQIPLKEFLWPQISWLDVLQITQGATLSQSHEISWYLCWEYLLPPTSINRDPIHRDIWSL